MPRRPLFLILGLIAPVGPSFAQSSGRPDPPRFSTVVAHSFDAWDTDHNARLSPDEIDRLVVNPAIRGQDAAALAAMKLVVRSTQIKPPVLTRDFIASHSDDPAGSPVEEPADSARSSRPPASLQKRFESALRRINSAKRELFADPTPDIDHCRQGPLGDCFLVAGVGAMVYRDAESVKHMIRVGADGAFAVEFGAGKRIHIPALTDAEFALTSTTGGEGYWLSVLEKAYGALRNSDQPQSKQTEESTDAIARGGSLGATLQALTGHSIDRTSLRSRATRSDSQAAAVAARVRIPLASAMKDKRLAGAGTGNEATPPAISARHAYAILAFDETSDRVLLWNPHGNNFRPRGEPGLANGYSTKAGQFEMPLSDFVRVFSTMVVETSRLHALDRPAEP